MPKYTELRKGLEADVYVFSPGVIRALLDERDALWEALRAAREHCIAWQGEPTEHSCSVHAAVVHLANAALAQGQGQP